MEQRWLQRYWLLPQALSTVFRLLVTLPAISIIVFSVYPSNRLPSLCSVAISHPIPHSNFSYSRGFVGGNLPHRGIDISVSEKTPLLAVRSGKIESVKWDRNLVSYREDGGVGFGYYIMIRYDDGHTGYYAHLTPDSETHSLGERIAAGEVLALSGNSGRSTGPHLHYGERDSRGVWIDPVPLIIEAHYREHPQLPVNTGLARTHRFEKRKQRNCQGEDRVKINISPVVKNP